MLAGRRSFESCLSTGTDTSLQECCPRYANEIAFFFLYVYIALLVFARTASVLRVSLIFLSNINATRVVLTHVQKSGVRNWLSVASHA